MSYQFLMKWTRDMWEEYYVGRSFNVWSKHVGWLLTLDFFNFWSIWIHSPDEEKVFFLSFSFCVCEHYMWGMNITQNWPILPPGHNTIQSPSPPSPPPPPKKKSIILHVISYYFFPRSHLSGGIASKTYFHRHLVILGHGRKSKEW